MVKAIAIAAAITILSGAAIFPAFAQNSVIVPGQAAPVPLPAPLVANPQPPAAPPRLDTFNDRVSRCVHFGAVQGLPAGARDAYTRSCANN